MKAKIQRLQLEPGRRILAVSDIHGRLDYLRGLLERVGFCEHDILFILGDFTEKGPESLATLRYIMALGEKYEVHTLCGNCDIWAPLLDGEMGDAARTVIPYMDVKPRCLARQMLEEQGVEFSPDMDYNYVRSLLLERYAPEFEFLRRLPTVIETEHYVFVHGGIPEHSDDAWAYMKYDRFSERSKPREKWTVCGHWPVMLYCSDTVCANPVFDRQKRIISIDGGCVLKDDGQLNALIIPCDGSGDLSFVPYDSFPTARVSSPQQADSRHWYIRWGDNEVEVLEEGEEFCRCRHTRTGYEMDILTKYLYGEGSIRKANDCTDHVLPLEKGDAVSVVETTSRGYFVKHKGVSGWYFGELEMD